MVVQKYIEDPFLFHKCKIDLRVFIYVYLNPFLVILRKGYARKAGLEYNKKENNLAAHIVNGFVQEL